MVLTSIKGAPIAPRPAWRTRSAAYALTGAILLASCSEANIREGVRDDVSVTGDSELPGPFRILILPPTGGAGSSEGKALIRDPRYAGVVARLTSDLSNSGRAVVIDRAKTAAALDEIAFGKTGLVDRATAPSLGRITGAEKILAPVVADGMLTLTLIDIGTTKIEYSQTVPLSRIAAAVDALIAYLDHRLLLTTMSRITNRSSPLRVTLRSTKQTYRLNDPIFFSVSVSQDAYVYLILIQSDGEILTLFPNRDQPNNFLPSGRAFRIPDSNSGFVFAAGPPFGRDVIKAIASRDRVNLLQTRSLAGTPFGQATDSSHRVARGIKRITTGLKSTDWNSAEVAIDVVP